MKSNKIFLFLKILWNLLLKIKKFMSVCVNFFVVENQTFLSWLFGGTGYSTGEYQKCCCWEEAWFWSTTLNRAKPSWMPRVTLQPDFRMLIMLPTFLLWFSKCCLQNMNSFFRCIWVDERRLRVLFNARETTHDQYSLE